MKSGGDECLPFLQMGQHCSGSYTGLTHSGTAQSDTTQCTSLFGSQRHHSQGDGCGQRGKEKRDIGVRCFSRFHYALHDYYWSVEETTCSFFFLFFFADISQLRCSYYTRLILSHKQRSKLINYSQSQLYQAACLLTNKACS